jgi:hypothetical protein
MTAGRRNPSIFVFEDELCGCEGNLVIFWGFGDFVLCGSWGDLMRVVWRNSGGSLRWKFGGFIGGYVEIQWEFSEVEIWEFYWRLCEDTVEVL